MNLLKSIFLHPMFNPIFSTLVMAWAVLSRDTQLLLIGIWILLLPRGPRGQ